MSPFHPGRAGRDLAYVFAMLFTSVLGVWVAGTTTTLAVLAWLQS